MFDWVSVCCMVWCLRGKCVVCAACRQVERYRQQHTHTHTHNTHTYTHARDRHAWTPNPPTMVGRTATQHTHTHTRTHARTHARTHTHTHPRDKQPSLTAGGTRRDGSATCTITQRCPFSSTCRLTASSISVALAASMVYTVGPVSELPLSLSLSLSLSLFLSLSFSFSLSSLLFSSLLFSSLLFSSLYPLSSFIFHLSISIPVPLVFLSFFVSPLSCLPFSPCMSRRSRRCRWSGSCASRCSPCTSGTCCNTSLSH